jgi:hypothetical protein
MRGLTFGCWGFGGGISGIIYGLRHPSQVKDQYWGSAPPSHNNGVVVESDQAASYADLRH